MAKWKQTKHWVDEIVEVLRELGGEAHLSQIYARVQERGVMHLDYESWRDSIRQAIQIRSSDAAAFKGGEDYFRSVDGLGSGVWGLRKKHRRMTRGSRAT